MCEGKSILSSMDFPSFFLSIFIITIISIMPIITIMINRLMYNVIATPFHKISIKNLIPFFFLKGYKQIIFYLLVFT